MKQALTTLILDPARWPHGGEPPHLALSFLITFLGLAFVGMALGAGPMMKPAVLALAVGGGWTMLWAFLAIASSLLAVTMSWKEAARLLALAGVPVLLKLVGGVATTAWTSLSPFYFTASPALFLRTESVWLRRLDLFELWSVALLWWLVRHCPGGTRRKAFVIAGLVGLTGAAIAAAIGSWG